MANCYLKNICAALEVKLNVVYISQKLNFEDIKQSDTRQAFRSSSVFPTVSLR